MAEPLKNQFGIAVPRALAASLRAADPTFPERAFMAEVAGGYEKLELMDRARRIASALEHHLPRDYPAALKILMKSLGPKTEPEKGMASFRFLPHVLFVARRGLDHVDLSLAAQHELTQRFTAEFSLRAFLDKHPAITLATLKVWTKDPSPHVRRLVSEGSRPRLPWAGRLRRFEKDPRPTLALLDKLKDDESLYVRKSVANHLNDIGKDHPALLVKTAKAWLRDAGPHRRWVLRHGLRTLLKQCHPGALAVLGYRAGRRVKVTAAASPVRPAAGGKVRVSCEVKNVDRRGGEFLVDFRVFYRKARGEARPKVFRMKAAALAPGGVAEMARSVSLKDMTTRKHFPGFHRVEVLVNGRAYPAGGFWIAR